nr:hypothetical protein BaRGS_013944 [Batillaria attramentaria]
MAATFTVLDYCLFIAVLLISALIGVFYMIRERRQAREATAEDILMGGREMGHLVFKVFTPENPWAHELRFNRATRCMASLLFVLEMLFYMAVVLYAPALALNEVWGAVIGSFIGQLTIYGASPTMLQRYMAIRDVRNSQSSVSSVLNALSITVLEDLVKPWMDSRGSHLSPRGEANLAKILGVCGGLAVIALAFLASVLGHTVLEIMITARGIGGGQLLGLFLLGMFFPCVNSAGAVAGFVVSSICTFWVAIGAIVLRVPQPTLPFSTAGCLAPSYSLLGDDNFNLITDLRPKAHRPP